MNTYKWLGLFLALNTLSPVAAQETSPKKMSKAEIKASNKKTSAYLFTYFTGNSKEDEQIRFAISNDGYNFRALNNNNPVISSENISETGGVRDPHILRGADGKTFYMVVTDMAAANGWESNRAMILLKSKDLINWSSSIVNIQKRFPRNEDLLRVWAPQTIYDAKAKKYMIYWSMKNGNNPDIIYYAYANKDFTDLETTPKQLFFSPTNGSCIDGDIIFKDGKYNLFFKTEGNGDGIKIATSNKLTEGYVLNDNYVQQTKDPVEGAGVFKLNKGEGYILMYDVYTKGKYQFTKTKDLKNFTVVDQEVTMNFHPRHGTVLPITAAEAERLESKWGSIEDIISSANDAKIKKINTKIDAENKSVYLYVRPNTNLKAFNPSFMTFPGIEIQPNTPQDFSKGPVAYIFSIKGHTPENWSVFAAENHNTAIEGL